VVLNVGGALKSCLQMRAVSAEGKPLSEDNYRGEERDENYQLSAQRDTSNQQDVSNRTFKIFAVIVGLVFVDSARLISKLS
jgi:hypothetical protein